MYQAAPAEAADLFEKVTAFIDACEQSINEADALITNIVETIEWSSFRPEQRARLAQWHGGVREARIALRK